jgi:hypothetical protein
VLKDAGIELEGKIALANYGGIYRGTKVKNAQDNGMIGCIIYTDPMDDGEITEENGYEAYPSKLSSKNPRKQSANILQMVLLATRLRFNEAAFDSRHCIVEIPLLSATHLPLMLDATTLHRITHPFLQSR